MRVAILTPYFKESIEVLKRCHDSIVNQAHADVVHYMVADGHAREELDSWEKLVHIKLPVQNNDFGDTPRCIGAAAIAAQDFDAICLLDADNWFEPEHVSIMIQAQQHTGAQIITSTRTLRRLDETVLGVCKESDGKGFNDTNCYFMTKPTFPVFSSWGFKDPKDGIVGDRIFWNAVQSMGYTRAHYSKPTVNYVTTFACHYQWNNETPPADSKVILKYEGDRYNRMMSYAEYVALGQKQLTPTK